MNIKGYRKLLTYKPQIAKLAVKELRNTKFCAMVLISVMLAGILSLSPAISTLISNITIRSSGTIATISPLHIEGRYIKDAFNNTIVLRGVNQAGMLDHPNGVWNPEGGGVYSGYGVWNPEAVKYNLDKMKEWGFNVVRLHTRIVYWINSESDYRQHIKDIITWAGERGIYVIFEPYSISTAESYRLPWAPYATDPEDQAIMPDRQAFINYWVSVANELKGYPNVIFEIYNEPGQPPELTYDEAATLWFETVQLWIDAVRATEADQLLIVQWWPSSWINLDYTPGGRKLDWVEAYPLDDPLSNIVYSTHQYRGTVHKTTPTRVDSWQYDDLKLGFQYILLEYVVRNLSKPLIIGEIGANMWWTDEELERELAYFNNSLTIYNEWGLNYVAWVWTVPAHMRHGLLQNGYPWLPPAGKNGEILINKIAEG